MADLGEEKFMLLYTEMKTIRTELSVDIKAIGSELTNLKDERIQQMQNELSALKVRMGIVFALLGLLATGFIAYLFSQWQTLTVPH